MSYQPSPLRGSRRSAFALLALLVSVPAHAEEKADSLEPLIVSALRTPRDASTVTSAVTVLDPEELESHGILQLRDALNSSPGVISTSTAGQTGALGNVFIRGTTTQYAQVVIDGMRLSDSNNPLGHILSGSRTYDVGSIEVLRGPQGAIYGGESIGGVLWMETPHGSGDPHGSTTFEAGSFDSLAAYGMFQGESGDLSYYLSGGYEETDNDAPENHFHQGSTALRVEGKIDSVWTVGTTFRAIDSSGQDLDSSYSYPGSIWLSTDSESHLDTALSTVYAIGKISDRWTARFNAGYYQESYDQEFTEEYRPYTPPSPSSSFSDLEATSVSTDHEITIVENLRLLAGAFFHGDSYESAYSSEQQSDRYGAHASLEWDVVEDLTTTASLRWEDYDSYGDEFTWRLGSIYTLDATGTTFRGSVGTSFRAPSYMELFYQWGGNPDLSAESAVGWDLGVEQKIGSHHTVELAWFDNRISDRIAYGLTYDNISGDTTTDGLELGLRGSWLANTLSYRLAWTYLHECLSDQPRNAATASLDWKPTPKSLIGIGATHLSDHSWGGNPIKAYTIARLFGSYQVTDRVRLHARVENAFDESYELSSFAGNTVEGSGTGLYAGITVDW